MAYIVKPKTIKGSEAPDFCSECGWPTIKGIHSIDCSNFDSCDWCRDYEDEPCNPTKYDYERGIIISD